MKRKINVVPPDGKYQPYPNPKLRNARWPRSSLAIAPQWCAVDLRDGNQALPNAMSVEQKLELFQMLVAIGFKQIEVGYPSASQTEFDFVRLLIEQQLIPDDVTIQVLVPALEKHIMQAVDSLAGAKKVIIHMYNSTSPAQRDVVFKKSKTEIVQLAIQGTKWIRQEAGERLQATEVTYQYSPESFSLTELDFAAEICGAVINMWSPTSDRPMILNLPETVQVAPPHVYANQIEWMCNELTMQGNKNHVIISVHTHNDRGTGVAASELAVLAGATRVEGTLFGNGERTGNLDLVTIALNMKQQGVNPRLDFSRLDDICAVYERCTGMTIHPRHPYAGEFAFTAISGTHQDAIKKGLEWREAQLLKNPKVPWTVPYLHIDPADVGRQFETRITTLSGKSGVAMHLAKDCGIKMPKEMIREFGPIVGRLIDELGGKQVISTKLQEMFWKVFVEPHWPYEFRSFNSGPWAQGKLTHSCTAVIKIQSRVVDLEGKGNGVISAFMDSLKQVILPQDVGEVLEYEAHDLPTKGTGADAQAIAYVRMKFPDGIICYGAGIDTSTDTAPIKAILASMNRHHDIVARK